MSIILLNKQGCVGASPLQSIKKNKGKPIERWGRKVSGLRKFFYDSGTAGKLDHEHRHGKLYVTDGNGIFMHADVPTDKRRSLSILFHRGTLRCRTFRFGVELADYVLKGQP